jgi:hypothetical protein
MNTNPANYDVRRETNWLSRAMEHCPKEINHWIARWENEGGAISESAAAPSPFATI